MKYQDMLRTSNSHPSKVLEFLTRISGMQWDVKPSTIVPNETVVDSANDDDYNLED